MPTVGSGNIQPGTGKVTYPGEVAGVAGATTSTTNVSSIGIIGINLNGANGAGVFSSSTGNNTDVITLHFRNIVAGAGVDITSDANTITITNTGVDTELNADWNATSGPSVIFNKPILSTVATTGSYTDLTNKPIIAVQVNSDWNAATGFAAILNKPILSTVATSGSYLDLTNQPTIPAAQINSDWNATSGLTNILNKPVLSTVATTGSYTDLLNIPTNQNSQVNSDWNATTGLAQILNKPVLAPIATTGSYTDLANAPVLATVATTGSYTDLLNIPTNQSAQVNSDWNSTTGLSQILNKPVLAAVATSGSYANLSNTPMFATVATSGSYTDLLNKPSIPAGQINSDWDATSGLAFIENKPAFANVAFSGSYADLLNTPSASSYQLPISSPTVLGGVKVFSGLTIDSSGNLSANVTSVQGQTGAVVLTAANVGAISTSLLGTANGVATLDINGTIPMVQLPPSIVGGLNYQGTWNATTNTPTITSGSASSTNKGWYFKVSTAGATTVDGNTSWNIGDWIVSDGTAWQQIHNTETVSSVNGATGAVIISPTSLGLATVATSGSYADLTNKPTIPTNTSQLTNGAGFVTASTLNTYAPLASPSFTGVPIAPNPILGSNNTQIATTSFVVNAITANAGVLSFNTRNGAITLTSGDVTTALGFTPANSASLSTYAPLASPILTGTPVAPTAATGTSTTQLATTAFVATAISTVTSASVASFNTRIGAITLTSGDVTTALGFTPLSSASLSTYAPLSSPALIGTPTAPTATAGTSTSQLATTAFVATNYAGVASPAFTGTPTAPTAAVGTNTTQIATTAYVAANSISANSPTIASPTLTSRSTISATSYGVTTLGSVSGTQTLNLSTATEWIMTITGNTTFAFSSVPAAGTSQVVALRLTNAGAFSIAWPTSTQFVGGIAPTFTTSGVDIVGVKYDTVTATYMVFVIGLNMLI